MAIFKFHSGDTKPSALKIWTTLIDTPIHPREGYTEDHIRYRMFICLQLSSDFKLMTSRCNGIIDSDKHSLRDLFESSCTLASCQESDFSDLDVLSKAFPHWVSSELYTPYYLTKMLCHRLNDFTLLLSLFDRTALLGKESDHWNIDQMSVDHPGLTAYKLYNYSIHIDEVLPYITISYDRTPIVVEDVIDIRVSIRGQLMQSIEVSDNFIIPDGAKTTIPYFVLKTDTTVPPVPPIPQTSSSTRPFSVGDRIQLRSNLVDNERYGKITFHEAMRFNGITIISETSPSGSFKVQDHSFHYSPEMLEHAEGGTDAS